MIQIIRSVTPKTLIGSPLNVDRYNSKTVVKALFEMQHGKCCYCEQEIPEAGHLKAVEHFKPKSIFISLRNDWNNLLLACSQCNGKKSDKFPVMLSDHPTEAKVVYIKKISVGIILIIDPSNSKTNPEDYLDFNLNNSEENYGQIIAKNNDSAGLETIKAIGLAGEFYLRKHRDHYIQLERAFLTLLQATEQNNQFSIMNSKNQWTLLLNEECKFAGLARAYARYKRLDRFGIEP